MGYLSSFFGALCAFMSPVTCGSAAEIKISAFQEDRKVGANKHDILDTSALIRASLHTASYHHWMMPAIQIPRDRSSKPYLMHCLP